MQEIFKKSKRMTVVRGEDENPDALIAKGLDPEKEVVEVQKGFANKKIKEPKLIEDANVFHYASTFDPPLKKELDNIAKSNADLKVIRIKENDLQIYFINIYIIHFHLCL